MYVQRIGPPIRDTYELVQAFQPKFRQPRMPHAIATRTSHILYHANCHGQWKRATASLFVEDLGLAIAPKVWPDQSQAFKDINNGQAFTVGKKKIMNFISERAASRYNEPLPGAPRYVQSLTQIFEEPQA